MEQIKLQLKKLVPVHKVADFMRNDKNVNIYTPGLDSPISGSELYKQKSMQSEEMTKV